MRPLPCPAAQLEISGCLLREIKSIKPCFATFLTAKGEATENGCGERVQTTEISSLDLPVQGKSVRYVLMVSKVGALRKDSRDLCGKLLGLSREFQ